MRVEIHLGARYGTGELLRAVRRVALRQLVGVKLSVISRYRHPVAPVIPGHNDDRERPAFS